MPLIKLNDKLIGVERAIEVHNLDGELISEIIINIPIDKLKQIVPPSEDDPELYDGYRISKDQLQELNKHLQKQVTLKFDIHSYFLVASGIYNW